MILNLFIDVANIIIAWIPLICYLGAGIFFIAALYYVANQGSPGRAKRGDTIDAILCFFLCAALASFPTLTTLLMQTFGFGTKVTTGGELFTYRAANVGFVATTPQQWFVEKVALFMPFFGAWGLGAILTGLLKLREARERPGVVWLSFGFFIGGVMLVNLDTLVGMIFPAG